MSACEAYGAVCAVVFDDGDLLIAAAAIACVLLMAVALAWRGR